MGVLPVESAVWHASHLKVPSKKVLLDSSRALERELSDSSLSQPLVFSISPPTSVRVFATLQRCSMATDSSIESVYNGVRWRRTRSCAPYPLHRHRWHRTPILSTRSTWSILAQAAGQRKVLQRAIYRTPRTSARRRGRHVDLQSHHAHQE